jgi:hypothetical protein
MGFESQRDRKSKLRFWISTSLYASHLIKLFDRIIILVLKAIQLMGRNYVS